MRGLSKMMVDADLSLMRIGVFMGEEEGSVMRQERLYYLGLSCRI